MLIRTMILTTCLCTLPISSVVAGCNSFTTGSITTVNCDDGSSGSLYSNGGITTGNIGDSSVNLYSSGGITTGSIGDSSVNLYSSGNITTGSIGDSSISSYSY